MYPSQGEENNMSEVTQAEKKEYQKYIKKVTPTHNLWLQMGKAFLVGGIICCIGQFLLNTGSNMGMDEKTAGSFCSLILILASVLLTGFHLFPSLVKWGGAGALVPITGFANSVVSPALEFQHEGFILGTASQMFTIAGPVIVYGVASSFLYGLIIFIFKLY